MSAPRPSALIIAGGRGTRFWPESRAWRPKPLFSIDGRSSLLADTVARVASVTTRARTFVLVSADQRTIFRKALRGLIPAANLVIEPSARGTAVAIAYGCATVAHRAGPGVVAVMPADHYITPPQAFRRTLADAIAFAAARHAVVVIGVVPDRPEPGYGYQQIGRPVGRGFEVVRFVEKPPLNAARRMVASGKFLWNAGMFVMEPATLLSELDQHAPDLGRAMREFGGASPAAVARIYRSLDFDAFDRVVAEKSRNVLGVQARFRWHDVGSWEGLWEALGGRDANVLKGEVIALDSEGVLARGAKGRLMVLLGVKDLVAVDTGDAILVAGRKSSQDLRHVVDELARRRLNRYL
ncbi:MAG TPA: sugar phosphate nucleotidyltransferase [Candidatus Binataceae bacterium]|nr:sugar phosphate nucleotidyltransferase [Candidatus Binataceae bacterium]